MKLERILRWGVVANIQPVEDRLILGETQSVEL
jgi:hypothetical protein